MTWMTPAEATLQITRGPFNASFAICARCHHVYWKLEPHLPTIVDSRHMPELKGYHEWREREAMEKQGREKNPLADKLYRQYLVALKLAGNQS
jgi:cytochrome c553